VTSVVTTVAGLGLIRADDRARDSVDAESPDNWLAARVAELEEYELIFEGPHADVAPVLVEQPLLSWSNPLRSTSRGALFVWTHYGKPQFVCCAYPSPKGSQIVHEMQSLADRTVTRRHAEHGEWVFEPPDESEVIPDAPSPAKSRTLRLTQMRRLAKRFTAEVTRPELIEVRLLPQPLFRYARDAEVDGAVFAFVQGTDPECLLILEASNDGWSSRMVRMTRVGLNTYRDGQLLRERKPDWTERDASYKNFWIQLP
jgi:hypothetical protein